MIFRVYRSIKNNIKRLLNRYKYSSNKGYCYCCSNKVSFLKTGEWLRDYYLCSNCRSIPRNRALIKTIQLFAPDYKDLIIHESSPGTQSSIHLKRNCRFYSDSQYFPDIKPGTEHNGFLCENLDALTFQDAKFDLFITSDVFEHIMNPDKAFSEVARVLKPGGMHIFTMPWYPKLKESRRRAEIDKRGEVRHLEEPIYHGNPVDSKGSLVTIDWGLDFCDKIHQFSGMVTTIYLEHNRYYGLDGEFLEVFVSRK